MGSGDEDCDEHTLRICRKADTVIWCTPAMQAWKASEERAWLTLPERVRQRGILAVTFEDAIASPGDAERLLARLHAEAASHFSRVVMASRLSALVPGHSPPEDAPRAPISRGSGRRTPRAAPGRPPQLSVSTLLACLALTPVTGERNVVAA